MAILRGHLNPLSQDIQYWIFFIRLVMYTNTTLDIMKTTRYKNLQSTSLSTEKRKLSQLNLPHKPCSYIQALIWLLSQNRSFLKDVKNIETVYVTTFRKL